MSSMTESCWIEAKVFLTCNWGGGFFRGTRVYDLVNQPERHLDTLLALFQSELFELSFKCRQADMKNFGKR